jgi:uncharacterized protein YcfJ
MNRNRLVGIMAIGIVAAVPALAQNGNYGGYGNDNYDNYDNYANGSYDNGNYRDDRYSGDEFQTAQVISAAPITRQVRITVPQRECYSETHYVPVNGRRYGGDAPAGGQMILGGLIGAVIGHQLDDRRSRNGGTVVGAVIGSAIGHDVAQRNATRYGGSDEMRAVDGQRCEVRYIEHVEDRVDGYRVTYQYNGRTYTTQMPRDPGATLRIRVNVAPVG